METAAQDVIATFAVTPRARALLRRWQADPARPHVPPTVMRHKTRVVYELKPSRIEAVCAATEHPLGDIRRQAAMAVPPIVDWRPDFAFTHVFHLAMETLGGLPTFQDFTRFCAQDPAGHAALGAPARQIKERACQLGYAPAHAAQAIRWRIGIAYYSFIREIYTISALRSCGLDIRAHPLADALFRADAWTGHTILSLYVSNPRFRDGSHGRKPRAADLLAGARPPFRYEELRLETRHEYGCIHLPGATQIRAIAQRLATPSLRHANQPR